MKKFKKGKTKVRPQACRFRIWKYEKKGGKFLPTKEINWEKGKIKFEWGVFLANRKANFYKFLGLRGSEDGTAKRNESDIRNNGIPVSDRKAKLWINPGPRAIAGKNRKSKDQFIFKPGSHKKTSFDPTTGFTPTWAGGIDYLGELRTDYKGRLLVIGGKGISKYDSSLGIGTSSLGDYANNEGWFDDVSDGWVIADVYEKRKGSTGWKPRIRIRGENAAWVIIGPPDYAPEIRNVVSLYDTLYDIAARKITIPADNGIFYREPLKRLKSISDIYKTSPTGLSGYIPNFNQEINPLLEKAVENRWVNKDAYNSGHHLATINVKITSALKDTSPSAKDIRDLVFNSLRKPEGLSVFTGTGSRSTMPKLWGDAHVIPWGGKYNELTISIIQYLLMKRWADGHFDTSNLPVNSKLTPELIDKAALDQCAGGGFAPGIEVGWLVRDPNLFAEPFRLKIREKSPYLKINYYSKARDYTLFTPGFFTKQLAIPWQADFLSCDDNWWPAQRPNQVFTKESDIPDASRMKEWVRGIPSWMSMKDNWPRLGFILKKGDKFFERYRDPSL